ncbi:MAG TPA: uroporphyrinogen-III C-methyltransferase [Dokdonella sp.]|uniref:uroporphyrinogen-III C-methyltransferase n=1 Tax=Dokdonella sp. TaxID=2291710 RepID=UPI002C99CE71|nr:uroporphyrinogen-III C-methyltransferase [Dokdonella sp.]HUD41857.1 uroporphyrinogen-III C-methyltransferase [Dokdonella sp.]
MDEAIESKPPEPVTPPAKPARRAQRGGLGWLLGVLALGGAAYAVWQVGRLEHALSDSRAAGLDRIEARLQPLAQSVDQLRRDVEAVRARVADGDGVNRSLREEVLGLGERSRNLEDAVANLADQRLSSRDAIALNEAEYLLLIARQRLELFQDAQGALAAYRLADGALAAAENPLYASTRQTIAAEIEALAAARPADTQTALGTLEQVRTAAAGWPLKPVEVRDAPAADSRFARMFGAFVRVSRDGTQASDGRDPALQRSLIAIDLRRAEAAVLARDEAAYRQALSSVQAGIRSAFNTHDGAVGRGLEQLDQLAATPLAPALPELGTALRELRNLRATRALSQPATPAAGPAGDPAAPPTGEPGSDGAGA